MSSPCRASWLAFGAALALAGCARETRDVEGTALASRDRAEDFAENSWQLAQGQRLFAWMNCSGCHSHGGGGMGPPLRDDEWRYGGSMAQIVSTILDGRPNGMPSFRGKITEQQAWQLASYVRSLSAQTRQDVLSGRADEMSSVEPPTLDERKPIRRVTPKQDDASEE